MESRIPLPTDNIYKFYALFGLLLFIFSASSTIYVERTTNELVFQTAIELAPLLQIANPSPVEAAKKLVLEKRKEIALSDRTLFGWAISLLLLVSISSMIYGFRRWHKDVQPVQDEMARL